MKVKSWLNSQEGQGMLQILRFGIVGISNNVISLAVYYLVIHFQAEMYLLGNVLGFAASTLNAYLLNSRFVFRVKEQPDKRKRSLLKTYSIYLIALCISTLLLYFMVNILQMSAKIAPLCSLAVTVPFTYLMNKFWVYR